MYTFAGVAAIILWSFTFLFTKKITEAFGTFQGSAMVLLLGGFMLLIPELLRHKQQWFSQVKMRYSLKTGSFFVLYMLCVYCGVGFSGSNLELIQLSLINYLWPLFTLIGSIIFLSYKARWPFWPASVFAVLGLAVVVLGKNGQIEFSVALNPLLAGLMLIAALSWGLYSTLTKYYAAEQYSGSTAVFMLVAGLVIACVALMVEEPSEWNFTNVCVWVFFAAINGLGYWLWDKGITGGNIALLGSLSYLAPLLTVLVLSLGRGTWPSALMWLGACICAIGSFIAYCFLSKPQGSSPKKTDQKA